MSSVYLSIETAAKECGVHTRTISRWIQEIPIPYFTLESTRTGNPKFFMLRRNFEQALTKQAQVQVEDEVKRFAESGMTQKAIGVKLAIPFSTVRRMIQRLGLSHLYRPGLKYRHCRDCLIRTNGTKRCQPCERSKRSKKSKKWRQRNPGYMARYMRQWKERRRNEQIQSSQNRSGWADIRLEA